MGFPHRRIGRGASFDLLGEVWLLWAHRPASSLDELSKLIDWHSVATLLDLLYSATKGEPAGPSVVMFNTLLLSIWYDLADVNLVEAFDARASFRRFFWFSSNEATPERAAFVRYLSGYGTPLGSGKLDDR